MATREKSRRETERWADNAQSDDAEVTVSPVWVHWPVNWSAVWIGALGSLAFLTLVGLITVAIGVEALKPDARLVDIKALKWSTTITAICGAFFAFVIGGWLAARVAGIRRSESAMLHGAIVWLVVLPLLTLFGAIGSGASAGGWLAGVGSKTDWSATPYTRPESLASAASPEEIAENTAAVREYRKNVAQWREETPKAARATALCAATALLVGLIGSVIGGWMASGEPMTFTHHRHRAITATNL